MVVGGSRVKSWIWKNLFTEEFVEEKSVGAGEAVESCTISMDIFFWGVIFSFVITVGRGEGGIVGNFSKKETLVRKNENEKVFTEG